MTNEEAKKLALELEGVITDVEEGDGFDDVCLDTLKYVRDCLQAIEQAEQAQPVFITHAVENAYDWSEWVCPDPKGYLMKCCDCGLVHEAQFKVVRYRSESEREDCDPVDDPNVQAVFRMRRSEQWSSEDMAYRAGGLPIEQAQKQEPVAFSCLRCVTPKKCAVYGCSPNTWPSETPQPRQPLSDEEIESLWDNTLSEDVGITALRKIVRAIEASHGIKGEA